MAIIMNKRRGQIEIGGERLTFAELSRRTGIAETTLQQRWQAGQREADLIAPVDRRKAAWKASQIAAQRRRMGLLPNLHPEPAMSYEEIAAELGIRPRSVYQIERMALAKIRRSLGL